MASEKLTVQALKMHDNVHPKYRSTKTNSTASKERPEGSRGSDGPTRKFPTLGGPNLNDTNSSGQNHGMSLFRLVAATRAWQRMAKTRRQVDVKPIIRYENTYKMAPDSIHRFTPSKVEEMVYDILETKLKRKTYSSEYCKSATTDLTSIIKAKVKMMDFKRYKIVCNVILMERCNQGVDVSSQCVWNCDTDSYATVTYSNPTITAVVFVHGVYFE